ncbi:OLC1v1013378C1 [Oldenlandia corymbosa var. corymbosa]|uniref:OLC1v1013378C1 n=1 Tax=Oldenlandia corymbosa var. corymbosa TaxID=529605 RepID=A0AAV1E1Q4_OLDCO|nr:OLC1v1013378C1 [Oldenlandia corymbosa var. corymbosa]
MEGRKASAAEASMMLVDFLCRHPCIDDCLPLGILLAGWENELGPQLYKVDAKGKLGELSVINYYLLVGLLHWIVGLFHLRVFLHCAFPTCSLLLLVLPSWPGMHSIMVYVQLLEVVNVSGMNGGDDLKYRKGTALGFVFKDEGIIVSLDHSNKLYPENDRLLNSHLFAMCRRFELEEGRRASAAETSKWLADHLACNPCSDPLLSLDGLITGWDSESGPALYKVNAKGTLLNRPSFGSGNATHGCSHFVIHTQNSLRSKMGSGNSACYNLSVTDAIKLARAALCHGALLVSCHGEFCSVFHVGSDRVKHGIVSEGIREWQEKYLNEAVELEKRFYHQFS